VDLLSHGVSDNRRARAAGPGETGPVDAEAVRAEFADRGVVRLDGAFAPETAARIREVVQGYAEGRPGVSWKGLKRHRIFDVAFRNRTVTGALDVIFGIGGWRPPKSGAQILVTPPEAGPWVLPDGWHMDCGFEQATWPVFAVKLFAFFGEVGPYGGGTMLLPGSHRLVERYRSTFDTPPGGGKVNWHPFLRRHPPLGDLLRGASQPGGGRAMVGARYDIDGIPVDVIELTGSPGDVVITHLHVFHTASPNTGSEPLQMLGKAVLAA
jgi:ectoine hydroxylase-related dioxygenase (phytanoyl-CoA dioxygenase family)